MQNSIKTFVYLLLFTLTFHSTAYAQLFGAMTIQEEYELGEQYNAIMKTQAPIIYDPIAQEYLQSIVDTLLEHAPAQPFEYEANLLWDKSLNAFAAPGGYVYIFTGLFLAMENESELAGVMAHEIAHVTQRHIAESQGTSTGVMLASLLAAVAAAVAASASGAEGDVMAGAVAGSFAAAQSAMLNYSRQDENEADTVGFEYMVNAGYDPHSYTSAFEKLQAQISLAHTIPTYLSSHPDLNSRISSIDARLRSMDIEAKELDNSEFLYVQSFIRAKYDTVQNAKVYFVTQDQSSALTQFCMGILYSREHNISQAQIAFENALTLEPNNPLFLREAGYFQYEYLDLNKAYDYVYRSYQLDSNDLMTRYYLARIYDQLGLYPQAQVQYEAILRQYPLDSEVHELIARSYGSNNDSFSAYLHLAYAELYTTNLRDAERYKNQAVTFARNDDERALLEKFDEDYEFYEEILQENS